MKFYDCTSAPSPRRVRIFMAEKGIEIPTVQIDLVAGEQFSEAYKVINSRCAVPALMLDDGAVISEVLAICRYLEEINPDPPLMGTTAKDKALVTMWERRMEIDGLMAAAEAVRNLFPGLRARAVVGPHNYEQIPALVDRGKARLLDFYADLDSWLGQAPYVAGEGFSIADITAVVTIDFAASRLKIQIPETFASLQRWHREISSRPSLAA